MTGRERALAVALAAASAFACASHAAAAPLAQPLAELGQIDLSKLAVKEGSAKVYEGPEGRRVTIVTVLPEASNRVLIKFEGIRGPWDGKTLLHYAQPQGPDSALYKTVLDGSEWTSVTNIHGVWDVFPQGGREFRVRYAERTSEQLHGKASAATVLEGFRRQR